MVPSVIEYLVGFNDMYKPVGIKTRSEVMTYITLHESESILNSLEYSFETM